MHRLRMLVIAGALILRADVRSCVCDASQPESMTGRECSLCRTAQEQTPDTDFFFVRDASPNKPNRLLAVPRFHRSGPQDLSTMTPDQRTAYWKAAIAKAREVWGDEWGLAINSLDRRTQCHMHIHVGKLLPAGETEHFIVVDGPASIPLPAAGDGLWVHPAGGKLHVHSGDNAPELLLQR